VVIASNRGPLSFRHDDSGATIGSRGGGGLVSAMSTAAGADGSVWLCAALSPTDREVAASAPGGRLDLAGIDTGGAAVAMLPLEERLVAGAYTAIANTTLWSLNHGLLDQLPAFDEGWRADWASYVEYNERFADAIAAAAAGEARVLVQDYHLCLVPAALRRLRPDLKIAHFMHTPWAPPDDFAQLPADAARDLVAGLLGADGLGFHSPRWAAAFAGCAAATLGADVTDASATWQSRTTALRIHPLGVDPAPLLARAAEPDVARRVANLREFIGSRRVIGRVDRTEPAKNILRGLLAVAELLRGHPEHRGRVVHVALAYPSRQDVAEYRDYTAECIALAAEINAELSTPHWRPVLFDVRDDYSRSLATLRCSDVLLVNSLRDGMNLVAKEGVLLSPDAALVLSCETGAADQMGDDALLVDPLDVEGTAEALHRALAMPAAERARRHERLAAVAAALPPREWVRQQLDALG
jgi:trehalose 6-phosphate synthase